MLEMLGSAVSHYGYIKPGFTTDRCSIATPTNFYLKWKFSKYKAQFAFFLVTRTSVTYKIGKTDFDTIFFPNCPESMMVLGANFLS